MPTHADIIAWGGRLPVRRLLLGYRNGHFPMYPAGDAVMWWSPDPRAVLFPNNLRVSRRLARRMRNWPGLRWCANAAFEAVLDGCAGGARLRDRPWLGPGMRAAYRSLHQSGHCHSYEAWDDDGLLGGVLLVQIGAYVAGETMFSARTDGSKVALAGLLAQIAGWPGVLFDCQLMNDHLARLGARLIPRHLFAILQAHAVRTAAPSLGTAPDLAPNRIIAGTTGGTGG